MRTIVAGSVYLAPGHSHLQLERVGWKFRTVLSQDPPVNRHRPSVEVLVSFGGTNNWARMPSA